MAERSHGSDGSDFFLTDDDGWPRTDATDELREEARPSGGALESSQTPVTQGAPRRKVTWDAPSTAVADKTEPHGDEWYQTERLRDEPESYSVLPDLEFKASVKTTHEKLQRCEDWIRWHRERLQEREAGPQQASGQRRQSQGAHRKERLEDERKQARMNAIERREESAAKQKRWREENAAKQKKVA